MNVRERYEKYIESEFNAIDFDALFNSIANESVYCPNDLLRILSLTFYSQLLKGKLDKLGEISSLEYILASEKQAALRTVPRLLYIVSYCAGLRDEVVKKASYSSLYM